jgi:ribonuclease P protein component
VVSTKVSKRAVVRNRIKRRMREAVRHIMPKIKPGHDITFVAKAISQDADFALLASDVTQALFKARLLV